MVSSALRSSNAASFLTSTPLSRHSDAFSTSPVSVLRSASNEALGRVEQKPFGASASPSEIMHGFFGPPAAKALAPVVTGVPMAISQASDATPRIFSQSSSVEAQLMTSWRPPRAGSISEPLEMPWAGAVAGDTGRFHDRDRTLQVIGREQTVLAEEQDLEEDWEGPWRADSSENGRDGEANSEEDADEWRELMLDVDEVLAELEQERSSAWLQPIVSLATAHDAQRRGLSTAGLEPESSMEQARISLVQALRELHYDAAVCSTSWEHTPGVPAGAHSFIDVVCPRGSATLASQAGASPQYDRVVVDFEFGTHFSIARMSSRFQRLWERLPGVYVGSEALLLQLVELMVEAMRLSLRASYLPVAPWRKARYMAAKWTSVVDRSVPADNLTSLADMVGACPPTIGSKAHHRKPSLEYTESTSLGSSVESETSEHLMSLASFGSSILSGSSSVHLGSIAGCYSGSIQAKKTLLPMGDAALLSMLAAKAARFSKPLRAIPDIGHGTPEAEIAKHGAIAGQLKLALSRQP